MTSLAKPALFTAALLTLLTNACSSGAPQEDPSSQSASAIIKTPPPNCGILACPPPESIPAPAKTCTANDLAPPSTAGTSAFACTGPWEYTRDVNPCYANGQSGAACGWTPTPVACDYATCPDPSFGVASYQNATTTEAVNAKWIPSVRLCDDPNKPTSCVNVSGYWDSYTPCDTAGQKYRTHVLAMQHAPSDYPGVTYRTSYTATGLSTMSCTITVSNAPVFYQEQSAVCGRLPGPCSVQLAKSCRDASFGFDPNPAACGLMPGLAYSSSGLTVAGVKQADSSFDTVTAGISPRCTTCESMPLVTGADAVARHDCYQKTLSVPSGIPSAALTKVQNDDKLLLELRAADLSVDRQIAALGLFQTTPDTASNCGLTFPRPSPVTCSADEQAQVDQGLSLCNEIAQVSILPDARSQYVEFCTDTVRGMAGLLDCEGYYDEYTQIMTALQNVMENSLRPSNLQDQALLAKVRAVLSN